MILFVQVFVYSAILKSNDLGTLLDKDHVEYKWLPKEEIGSHFHKREFREISGMLVS